jgi:hypothetical protein
MQWWQLNDLRLVKREIKHPGCFPIVTMMPFPEGRILTGHVPLESARKQIAELQRPVGYVEKG